ncbi:hypothetical protein [Sphingomonas sp. Leaf29]|uniref:hypothetical protein n=2 Tax=Sphingomonas TaxID=13687 RepID=UPI000A627B24|nr:hypothetical protein [Sphingomonas sp. Leaf29]
MTDRYIPTPSEDSPVQVDKPSKRDAFQDALAVCPTLAAISRGLEGREVLSLTHVPVGDRRVVQMVASEIVSRLSELVRNGRLDNISMEVRYDSKFDSRSAHPKIDLKQLAKFHGIAKKASPHCISQIVTACGGSEVEGESFALANYVVTLALKIDNVTGLAPANSHRIPQGAASGSGLRPTLKTISVDNPTVDDVEKVVGEFVSAQAFVRDASVAMAKDANLLAFKKEWVARRFMHLQADALIPFVKAFLGAGIGDTILKIAMAAPAAAARENKRRENAMTRDELLHLVWSDALDNGRKKPPLIIM